MSAYAIKFKNKTDRAWWFMTPRGGANRLRIYAAQNADKAHMERQVEILAADNHDLDFKVVKL
jgi:hypothetical protein